MSEESVDLFLVMLAYALSWLWGTRSDVETTAIYSLLFAEREGIALFVPASSHVGSIPGIAVELNMPISISRAFLKFLPPQKNGVKCGLQRCRELRSLHL